MSGRDVQISDAGALILGLSWRLGGRCFGGSLGRTWMGLAWLVEGGGGGW